MAAPTVAFTLSDGTRTVLSLEAAQGELFEARLARLGAVLGRDFAADALRIDADRQGHRLTGYAGLPTDRKSVVSGKSVSVRVTLGGRRILKKKKENSEQKT